MRRQRKLSNGRERLVAGFEPLRFDCIKNNTKALPWHFIYRGLEPNPTRLFSKDRSYILRRLPKKFCFAKFFGFEPLRFDCIKNNTKALPWCYFLWSGLRGSNPPPSPWQGDALPNELNPHRWCLRSESNQRHGDFQSPALPTELQRLIKQGLLFY